MTEAVVFCAVSVEQYFGPYWHHPEATEEMKARAQEYLDIANPLLCAAQADGVVLHINPKTGCYLGGSGNGGFRPIGATTGAIGSQHKRARAGDWFDPERALLAWSLKNKDRLIAAGIKAVESSLYTPTWAHWQSVPVPSGHFAFVPARDAEVLAAALPEEAAVNA